MVTDTYITYRPHDQLQGTLALEDCRSAGLMRANGVGYVYLVLGSSEAFFKKIYSKSLLILLLYLRTRLPRYPPQLKRKNPDISVHAGGKSEPYPLQYTVIASPS